LLLGDAGELLVDLADSLVGGAEFRVVRSGLARVAVAWSISRRAWSMSAVFEAVEAVLWPCDQPAGSASASSLTDTVMFVLGAPSSSKATVTSPGVRLDVGADAAGELAAAHRAWCPHR
jgi:hypothetical protein